MTAEPSKPRVGLLALSLELYEQLAPTLRPGREQWVRETVLPALEPLADVVFHQAVYRREDIDRVVADFEAAGVDALLVMCLTYSPSQLALAALVRTRLTVIIWNTQELFGIEDGFGGTQMIDNHGVHGTQDLANVLLRSGVRFEYVTSHINDPAGLNELGDFFAAASAVAVLRNARLGLMGYPFPGMGDFAVDSTRLVATLGCQWMPLSVEDYIQRAAAAPVEQAEELVDEYRRLYDLADDLTAEDLAATARAELAMRQIVDEHRLDGLSYQFMSFGQDERTETLPFVAASRLMADRIAFGGEGDLIGAAGTLLLGRLRTPATFSEVFTIDFASGGLFMSHMGEANVAMARTDRKVPLVARAAPITRTRAKQLALVTSLQPGPATLCALAVGPDNRWRLIASRIEVDDFGPLESMQAPHFRIRPAEGDVRDWLTAYAKLGGPHHNAIAFGDATARIRRAAGLIDAEYHEV